MAGGIDVDIVGIKGLRNRLKGLGASAEITEALRARLTDVWARGAAQFVQVALRRVAVDTGMSAATFYSLSKLLSSNHGLSRVLSITEAKFSSPKKKFRKGVPTFPSGARRSGIQDVDEGKRLGERAFIFHHPMVGDRFFVFQFSFQTVSWQMAFHDKGVEALVSGIEAFEARVAREFEQQARFVLREFFRGRSIPSQGIGQ